MTVESLFEGLQKAALRLGPKVLYPGFPFFFVPSLLAGLIGSQFSGNLSHFPSDRPAALELPVSVGLGSSEVRREATLLVVPATAEGFFIGSTGEGISSIWLSMPSEKMSANKDRVTLEAEGLNLDPLRGVDYPLVVVIEGSHSKEIEPVMRSSQGLPRLELATPDSNWIVLSLLGSAVFGFGASTGFFKDGSVV